MAAQPSTKPVTRIVTHARDNNDKFVDVRFVILCCLLLTPALAHAQAEPAPEGYVPPGKEPLPPPPSPLKWHVAVDARLAVPIRQVHTLPPVGWGAGIQVSRALIDVGRMRVGIGADFAYQRVQGTYRVQVPPTDEFVSNMTFAALLVIDGIFDRVRPWVAVGGGFAVSRFFQMSKSGPAIDVDNVEPLVEIGLGLGVRVWRWLEVGVGGELDLTFASLAVGEPPVEPFQPGLFVVRAGAGFRF
jgi:hypothetical protein